MKLHPDGWKRLKIVLSVCWCIVVASYVTGTAIGILPPILPAVLHVALFEWAPGTVNPDGWQDLKRVGFNFPAMLVAMAVPVALIWIMSAALGWVYRGFGKR